MGVSRAPVREALRQLEQEGLIEFYPHRGAVVVGVPEDEIDVIYQLRAKIEEEAIIRLCANATQADIARLEECLAEIKRVRRARDMTKIAEADLQFHRALVDAFNQLYAEGQTRPRVLGVGLHPFLSGQPYRARYIAEAIAYMRQFPGVWFPSADEIADWYLKEAG